MNKDTLIDALLGKLESDLRRLKGANRQAVEGATDSESKAETKWDTGGLEASYLARGYARQFEETAARLQQLRNFQPESFSDRPIDRGALVECDFSGERAHVFLFDWGGLEVNLDGLEVMVISTDAPLGQALRNRREGQSFAIPGGMNGKILRVE